MRTSKHRICLGCSQPFRGRADAKTCSAKCRKRFQRGRAVYQRVMQQTSRPGYAMAPTREGAYAR
jgi:predicted nucleic acid-binding Zn ribbon protein